MNDFGVDITGLKAIYRPHRSHPLPEEARTFTCESGPGCDPKAGGLVGMLYGARTIKARYDDGLSESIDSYSIEAIIKNGQRIPKPQEASEPLEAIAYIVTKEGTEAPKVFIPVKQSPTGRLAKESKPNLQNVRVPLSPESKALSDDIKKAMLPTAAEVLAVHEVLENIASPARTSRSDRDTVVSSPEFIALFETVKAKRRDQSQTHCKNGHLICAANAHVGDLRRPPHRYSCDKCLRKEPADAC